MHTKFFGILFICLFSMAVINTANASKTSGPNPSQTHIPAGESRDFTWNYSADAAGVVTFSGDASVGEITSPIATSNNVTIQILATLEIIS
ncbi:hypothetical protein H8E77_41475 [bacterium]|nr:hypothetical protein [bacterium]